MTLHQGSLQFVNISLVPGSLKSDTVLQLWSVIASLDLLPGLFLMQSFHSICPPGPFCKAAFLPVDPQPVPPMHGLLHPLCRTNNLNGICCSPSTEAIIICYQICQSSLTSVNPMWPVHNRFFFMCLEMASKRICSITFLGKEVRPMGLYFPGTSFLPWRCAWSFPYSSHQKPRQSPRPFKDESSVVTASASSNSTLACIPFGLVGLIAPKLHPSLLWCWSLPHSIQW